MAEHENSTGASDDWHTPQALLDAIGLEYWLDPCAPTGWRRQLGKTYFVPAAVRLTAEDDGLAADWRQLPGGHQRGPVFVNPPFGGRHGHLPWLKKWIDWGQGVAICRAYTSAAWWHDFIPLVDGILFPRGKTQFVRPDGTVGKSPGHGVTLLAMGQAACRALEDSRLGIYFTIQGRRCRPQPIGGWELTGSGNRHQPDLPGQRLLFEPGAICERCEGFGYYSPSGGLTDTIDTCPECDGATQPGGKSHV